MAEGEALPIPDYSYAAYQYFIDCGYTDAGLRKLTNNSDLDFSYKVPSHTDTVKGSYTVPSYAISGASNSYNSSTGSSSTTHYSGVSIYPNTHNQNFSTSVTSESYTVSVDGSMKEVTQTYIELPWLKLTTFKPQRSYFYKGKYILSFYASDSITQNVLTQGTSGITFKGMFKDYSSTVYSKYVFELDVSSEGYYTLQFPSDMTYVIPLYFGSYDGATSECLQAMGYLSREEVAINRLISELQSGNATLHSDNVSQLSQDKKQHSEQMDTSETSKLSGSADDIMTKTKAKTKSLFYPIQEVIDTGNRLASAPGKGTFELPAIFSDGGTWTLDLTVFERELPQAWTFIISVIRLSVAGMLMKGLYNMIFRSDRA